MMMFESSLTLGSRTATTSIGASSLVITSYRPWWISDDATGVHFSSRRPASTPRLIDSCSFRSRTNFLKNRIRAKSEFSSSESDPRLINESQNYHPYEEIEESTSENNEDASLSAAETTRTLIEVNSKATLMFSGLVNDEVHENIFWPDLPYLSDENGNIYFEVNDDEDILQSLTTENNFVQVIIGLDTTEMLSEMELGSADFGIEEISEDGGGDDDDEDGDDDDELDEDWVSILDDDEEDEGDDETLGDWAKLETMRSSHPMYFAKKMAEVTTDDPMDWMDQTSSGIAIQGLLRPAFIEEQSVIRKNITDHSCTNNDDDDTSQVGKNMEDNVDDLGINGHEHKSDFRALSKDGSIWAVELEKDENLRIGTSFYKLEMTKILLVSPHGNQTVVEVQDFRKAHPDAIAHSAAKIISRLKAGGEKTIQALKSLCWRIKGLQVEDTRLIGVDSLGFDLRVCSGTQVQTLRFAFNTRATSEYSAERQLRDLVFPRIHPKPQKREEARQKEC